MESAAVVSDFLRRSVARTMAQQVSKEVEEAMAPFQHALKTRVDGVGASDLVSRNAMLRGLMSHLDNLHTACEDSDRISEAPSALGGI